MSLSQLHLIYSIPYATFISLPRKHKSDADSFNTNTFCDVEYF